MSYFNLKFRVEVKSLCFHSKFARKRACKGTCPSMLVRRCTPIHSAAITVRRNNLLSAIVRTSRNGYDSSKAHSGTIDTQYTASHLQVTYSYLQVSSWKRPRTTKHCGDAHGIDGIPLILSAP